MTIKTLLKFALTFSAIVVATSEMLAQSKPSAVLVMLNSEQNRIEYVQKNSPLGKEEVKNDAGKVIIATKNDFKDHFTYCQVYYFMDSNMAEIKAHHYAGVIKSPDDSPVTEIPRNFIIAYYGYPLVPRSHDARLWRSIVIADKDLKQLYLKPVHPLKKYFHTKAEKQRYTYTARHYDIEYRGIAGALQRSLEKNKYLMR